MGKHYEIEMQLLFNPDEDEAAIVGPPDNFKVMSSTYDAGVTNSSARISAAATAIFFEGHDGFKCDDHLKVCPKDKPTCKKDEKVDPALTPSKLKEENKRTKNTRSAKRKKKKAAF